MGASWKLKFLVDLQVVVCKLSGNCVKLLSRLVCIVCLCEYGSDVSGFLYRHDADSMAAAADRLGGCERKKSINIAQRSFREFVRWKCIINLILELYTAPLFTVIVFNVVPSFLTSLRARKIYWKHYQWMSEWVRCSGKVEIIQFLL